MADNYNKISISIDVDWAHDEVIDYLSSIFDKYGINVTFFCTHKINLESIKKHELAIHPNFIKGKADQDTIQELMEIYPGAKGSRSHGLYLHGGLFDVYNKYGLEYDSNYFLPDHNVNPFFIVNGIVELPMIFTDDALHLVNSKSYDIKKYLEERKGLKIFTFHPIHVFLNTKTDAEYQRAKPYLQKPTMLKKFRNRDKGTNDILIELLDYVTKNNIRCCTLKEVSDEFKKAMG